MGEMEVGNNSIITKVNNQYNLYAYGPITLDNSTFEGMYWYGIWIKSSNNTITNNVFRNSQRGLYFKTSSNNIVNGNTFYSISPYEAIFLSQNSINNTIESNNLTSNKNGISTHAGSDNTKIIGNNISFCTSGYAINLGSSHNRLIGNRITNNLGGISGSWSYTNNTYINNYALSNSNFDFRSIDPNSIVINLTMNTTSVNFTASVVV